MKKILSIFFLLFSLASSAQDIQGYQVINGDTFDIKGYKRLPKPVEPPPAPTCSVKGIRRYLTPASWGGVYLNGKDYKCNPGDTIVVKSTASIAGVDMENFHGTASCPIVIINEGDVKMAAGFKMSHCTFIKLTGSGTASKYGFIVEDLKNGGGEGVNITGRSANIEIERLYVHKKAYGVSCRQEAACPDSLQYPNWWIDNISLHDCSFFNIGQDCLYFGSTNPTGGQRYVPCNGINIAPIPLRLSNIRIYNNIIDSCNRTGIQLSGADRGDNRIYNNIITRCGFEHNNTQGDGIALGGMSRAWVHDNYIRQTWKHGLFLIGSGPSKIENNDVDSSGMLGPLRNDFMQPVGIFADSRLTVPANDSVSLSIRNNILGKNTQLAGQQIVIFNSNNLFGCCNIISGNKTQTGEPAKISVAPSIKWSAQ